MSAVSLLLLLGAVALWVANFLVAVRGARRVDEAAREVTGKLNEARAAIIALQEEVAQLREALAGRR